MMARVKSSSHKIITIMRLALTAACVLIFCNRPAHAAVGTINGRVVDRDTQAPLVGTTVQITVMSCGTATDTSGEFTFADIPVGSYVIEFSRLGYESLARPDIIVKSKRTTFVSVELKVGAITGDDVIVTSKYFSSDELQTNDMVELSGEEIRRIPGAFGDISKAVGVLPAVNLSSGLISSLIVRGGNPIENGYILDNINVPTINHYPIQGSSGGGVGLLNLDFIRDIKFHVGGFPSAYGDKLSSYLDIAYREGNRERIHGQAELDFSGVRVAAEGPLPKNVGSWLWSSRYSSLDLLDEQLELYVVPRYIDHQGKLSLELSPRNRLSALVLLGRDEISFTQEDAREHNYSFFFYGQARFAENVAGVNWVHLWPEKGHAKTSVTFAGIGYDYHIDDPRRNQERITNKSNEQDIRLRNLNSLKLNEKMQLEFGLDARFINNQYDNYYNTDTEPTGEITHRLHIDTTITARKIGINADLSWEPTGRTRVRMGLRGDYFTGNDRLKWVPRVSLSYRLSPLTSLNAAAGLYNQTIPLILLSQNSEHCNLRDPRAMHLMIGLNRLIAEDTRISITAYAKEYWRMPLDPNQPGLFILDELVYRYWVFYRHERLIDNGRAFARGVELLLQKKLSRKLHCLISGAVSKTRYRDVNGIWHDRVVDNLFSITLLAGFRPNNSWDCSVRWSYSHGIPYTPFDLEKSKARRTDIFDLDRINDERLPPNHSLYLRLERRFHFSGSALVVYLSVWNVYDRENIYGYKWNEEYNYRGVMQTGGIVPIFGLKYEF